MRASWVIAVALSGCGFSVDVPAGDMPVGGDQMLPGCDPTWVDGAWHAREAITIDHNNVMADLADFPLLVDLPIANVQRDALRFTAADGLTPLSHEVEVIDATHVVAWVRVALSSNTDTTLYVYYDNATPTKHENAHDVWRDYAAVWHMAEDPSAGIAESTGAIGLASARGTMRPTDQVAGKIGGSVKFDGSDDGIDTPSITIAATFTYEAWIRKAPGSGWRCWMDNQNYDRWFGTTDNQQSFWDGNSNIVASNVTANTWYHFVATYDGQRVRIYRNGQPLGTPFTKTYGARTGAQLIGYTNTSVGEYFPGQLDELRVANVARSPEYIATSYRNQNDPRAFASTTAPETCP